MGKKLVSKTAKVLSETKKSKDREAVAVAYEHIPRNPEEQTHGSLYAVIEVEDSTGHAEEVAESLIDTLHNEYYSDTDRDSLASFEAALAKINEDLAERSSEGQINWLGKLNAILAVLSGSTIHITQAGKAEAFLYRGDHTIHITDDLSGDAINPLRTFINVASGDLTENDKLAIVTPGVFLKLSQNELKKYITSGTPKSAVENLSELLASENGNTKPNAVLVMEMVSPEAYAASTESEPQNEAWVKEERKPLEPITDRTVKGTAKVFDFLGKAASGASAFVSAKIIPSIKAGAGKLSAKVKGFSKEKDAQKIILESEESITGANQNLDEYDDGILETPATKDNLGEYRIREEEAPNRLSLERFNFSFITNAKDKFLGSGRNSRGKSGKKTWLIAGIILLTIFIIGTYSVISSNNRKDIQSVENKYNQAQTKYQDALTKIAAGQRTLALEDLSAAENLANEVKETKYKNEEANNLLSKITETREQALGIIKNTASSYFDFGKGGIDSIYSDGKLFYALKSDGSVYALDPKAKTSATVLEAPNIDGSIRFSTFIPTRKMIVAYTDKNNLYEIDVVGKKATKQNVTNLESGNAASSYLSNIYILDGQTGKIYKHLKTTGGYGTGTDYLSANESVNGAVDLAIDSSIYVLFSNGSVNKYTTGKRDTFSLKNNPEQFQGLEHIYTNADIKGVYLYNKEKIIKYDSNQNFVSQYINDSLKNIASIYVDDTTSTIFAVSDGKVYTISF